MLTDNDLLAISELLDKKVKPLKEDGKQMYEEMHNIKLLIENDVMSRLQNIESC